MNKIPFQVKDISNPAELYGRNQLIDRLVTAARMKQNTNLIGARRFGKTCVLKSTYTVLRAQMDEISVYPVYIVSRKQIFTALVLYIGFCSDR